jgi:microcystin-dependent protein
MSEPFIGEIRAFGFNFPPYSWASCNGQIVPISQNTALFALLGTTYGGDGRQTFGLPNLQGLAPLHQGAGNGLTPRVLGETGGSETVTLSTPNLPSHTHALNGANAGSAAERTATPTTTASFGSSAPNNVYASTLTQPVNMSPKAIATTGGNQPHANAQPRQVLNFCIALQGIFPVRN